MPETTQQLADYLQACFAWEYRNLGGQNLLSNSLRGRHFLTIDTLFSGLANVPKIAPKASKKLVGTLQKHTRSSDLWYGIFPLQARLSSRRFKSKHLCAPLFIADLNEQHLTPHTHDGAELASPLLIVNRLALSQLLDNDVAERLADELQKVIDAGPLGKAEIDRILALMAVDMPTMTTQGFELYPLLSPQLQLADKIVSNKPVLTCAGVVYLSKRSRQSMGVLHELGKLKKRQDFSLPLTNLVSGQSHSVAAPGPLNVIGALSSPQRKAIMAARQHSLSVVHGPPGTGKTHVLAMLAADQIANGQSVLVCTRNNAAIDVIENVICDRLQIEEAIVRGGSFHHLRQLKLRLTQILQQGQIAFDRKHPGIDQLIRDVQGDEIKALKKALRKTTVEMRKIDRQLNRLSRRISAHVAAEEDNPSLAYRLSQLLRLMVGMKKSPLLLARLTERWRVLQEQRESSVIIKLRTRIQLNVAQVLRNQRSELSRFARSVTAKEANQRSLQTATDYSVITQTLPLWMSSLADLSHILPLEKELFDVLIIDEGSQADIASALPAIYRAKRAVIIGDAHQLRHVSFLPTKIENELLSNASLSSQTSPSFRNDSILDWTNRQIATSAASSFLDEHFRSRPPIIEFSNREFYGNQLKLLTQIQYNRHGQVYTLVRVENASRDSRTGANRKEAETLIDYLQGLITTPSDATDSTSGPLTIGVLSPFRAQIDLLEQLITQRIDSDALESVDFMIGTAHELQGEERDIMLFSACIDESSSAGSLTFLSRPDVLNVSVTRAKHKQVVFLSRSVSRFDRSTLFGRYVHYVEQSANQTGNAIAGESRPTPAVEKILAELDIGSCKVRTNIDIGSARLDVLLLTHGQYLGIDLIGFGGVETHHGLHQHELELLYRLNVPVIPITEHDWHVFRPDIVEHINQRIGAMTGEQS